MFGIKKKPMRNDLLTAYEPKRDQNVMGAPLLAVAQVKYLRDDEKVVAVLSGQSHEKGGLFILTDSRLLMIEGNILVHDSTVIESSHITGVSEHSTLFYSAVTVTAGSHQYTLDKTLAASHKRFMAALQSPLADAA